MGNNIAIWQFNGTIQADLHTVSLDPSTASLDDATRQLPRGAYTTFRTFNETRVMGLSSHFERLEESARLAGKPFLFDRERTRAALSQSLQQARQQWPGEESRVRLILDLEQKPGTQYLLIERLILPASRCYETGVRAITRAMHRENPKAKLTSFIDTSMDIRKNKPAGIEEVLMVAEDGKLLEGLSSNFFAVLDGVIWTADEGVLAGITRSLVLDVIREKGFPLKLEGIGIEKLGSIRESFITSASRAVLPVVEIDGRMVGDGRPGGVAKELLQGYVAKVEAMLEEL